MREKWLALRQKYPHADRVTLNQKGKDLKDWLSENDWDWLQQHLPPRRNSARNRTQPWATHINWANRDSMLAEAVRVAAQQIQAQPGKPEQIRRAALRRRINLFSWSDFALDRMPETKRALETVTESGEAFALRKVYWAECAFREENHCPSRSEFVVKAGVPHYMMDYSTVQAAVEDALDRLSRVI
jgi:hypothetical protein